MHALLAGQPEHAITELALELRALRESMLMLEATHADTVRAIAPRYRASARNLLHYVAMRREDLRPLQAKLAALGLSSLGRAEACVLSSVDTVLGVLERISGAAPLSRDSTAPCDLSSGAKLLERHTEEVFGPEPARRSTRIMVTMPSEAAADSALIRSLVASGMDCMRINCAHDGPEAWQKMVGHLQQACTVLGRSCTILMDLAGPKLRTGDVEAAPAVQKVRPTRDALGRVTTPAIVWLTDAVAPAAPPCCGATAVLHVAREWLRAIRQAEEVGFFDTRKRFRVLKVVGRDQGGIRAELGRTAYIANGTKLERITPGRGEPTRTEVSGIAAGEGTIHLAPGDLLTLTRDPSPGRGASFNSAGELLGRARVSCTLPEVFACVKPGERVCLDDGKIRGVAESVSASELTVRIQHTPPKGARLRADKGVNLPESELQLPALTAKDKVDLEFAVRHADLIGLSFVNRDADVLELIRHLDAPAGRHPGLVLKIETQRAFACLPSLLLTAMRHERVGVMIARGDLAVECGYERLAEVQEEILWMCEAAHCPAIWATQVLETLAQQGTPSRAEITDAAMGHRAECVMLNKGPHIEHAVSVLDDILRRMESHQTKKRAMLRALHMAMSFDTAGQIEHGRAPRTPAQPGP